MKAVKNAGENPKINIFALYDYIYDKAPPKKEYIKTQKYIKDQCNISEMPSYHRIFKRCHLTLKNLMSSFIY